MAARKREQDDKEKQQDGRKRKSRKKQDSESSRGQGRGSQRAQSRQSNNRGGRGSRDSENDNRDHRRELEPAETFEPVSTARLATLRLARNWRFGGNVYGAMYAYERIFSKYGGTPAAHAAAEEMISMAMEVEEQGKFYTALNIFNKIEEYYSPWREEFYDPWRTAYVRAKQG